MNRADMTPVVSHGRQAAKEAARAKRALDPTFQQPAERRNAPANGYGASIRRPRSVPPVRDGKRSSLAREGVPVDRRAPRRRRPPVAELTSARAGDHPEIYQFLLAVFQGPSREEYHAVQDDPAYDPAQRLLIKREGRIAAHLQLTQRTMCFGQQRLPIGIVNWLGTLPEFRSQGYARWLLQRAEHQMRGQGAVLGVLRTRIPQFFRSAGWAVCGRYSHAEAMAREVLARLAAEPGPRLPLSIRLWRHVELPSLMRIYAQNTSLAYGPLERIESYWRWLISRKAFDHIIVAIHGRDRMELVDTNAPIVGYGVVSQGRVVELLTSPDYPTTAIQILARACGDTIERNRHTIVVEAPPGDPLHALLAEAGGSCNSGEVDGGEVQMVKVIDPAQFVKAIEPALVERARKANLPATCDLGLFIEGTKHMLAVTGRSARLTMGKLGRSYLALKWNECQRLLLGHNDVAEAVRQERIVPSTQIALETAQSLFPRLPLWRPRWDELPA
jgi:GNAT superfamily N-acetyltransferase